MEEKLKIIKAASVKEAVIEDLIVYTIELENIGDCDLVDIIVRDVLSPNIKFIEGSICIDSITKQEYNILHGINIEILKAGESKLINFKTKVIDNSEKDICNVAIAYYKFKSKFDENMISTHVFSNEEIVEIKNINVSIKLETDKKVVFVGDKLEYFIKIKNESNVNIEYLFIKENLSKCVSLEDGSFFVDNRAIYGIDLSKGFTINNLSLNKEMIIRYKVNIIDGGLSNKILNIIKADIAYKLYNQNIFYKALESNRSIVEVKVSNFKEICIDKYLSIENNQAPILEINQVKGNIEILNFYVLKGLKATSDSGQKLSGNKVIITASLNLIVEYIADNSSEAIYSNTYKIHFSTFIVISSNYISGNFIMISGNVQSIYFKKIDSKNFFINANVSLISKQ